MESAIPGIVPVPQGVDDLEEGQKPYGSPDCSWDVLGVVHVLASCGLGWGGAGASPLLG